MLEGVYNNKNNRKEKEHTFFECYSQYARIGNVHGGSGNNRIAIIENKFSA